MHPYYQPGHHPDDAFYRSEEWRKNHHWRFGDMPPVEGITEKGRCCNPEVCSLRQEQNGSGNQFCLTRDGSSDRAATTDLCDGTSGTHQCCRPLAASVGLLALFERVQLPIILAYLLVGVTWPLRFRLDTSQIRICIISPSLVWSCCCSPSALSFPLAGSGLCANTCSGSVEHRWRFPHHSVLCWPGAADSHAGRGFRSGWGVGFLNRSGHANSVGGPNSASHMARLSVAVLIFQDLAVIPGLIVIPGIGGRPERCLGPNRPEGVADRFHRDRGDDGGRSVDAAANFFGVLPKAALRSCSR